MLKEKSVFAVFMILVLLVSIAPVFVVADSHDTDNSGSGSESDSTDRESDNSGSGSSDDDSDDTDNSDSDSNDDREEEDDDKEEDEELEDDDREEEDDDRNGRGDRVEFRERTREIVGDCIIKIEKRVRIENGEREEKIEKIRECVDGTKEEIKIRIENRSDNGEFRERIKYEFRNGEREVEIEEGIEIEEELNETDYRLKARLRNGNVTDIKIMPDTASEIALERLRANNFTVELREIRERNVPRVVYHIESDKEGRFLGVFKLKVKVEGQIDPETGEVIEINKPWWAFLVEGEDSDQTGTETDEEETGNETQQETPAPGNEGVEETIVVNSTNSTD